MGKLTPQGKEIENFDKVFEMKLRYFENTATFVQKFKITDASYQIEGYLEYGACNDENCLPPTEVPFSFSGKGNAATATVATSETKAETVNQPAAENSVAETTRSFLDIYFLCRIHRWVACLIHSVCMAYYSNDRKFLPETQQR